MSFEDGTSTELKEFFSSKIDKVLGSKLDRLEKLDKVFEELALLRSENKDLQQQNLLLTQQVANLNTSLQDFCQKSVSELKELKDGQMKLKKLIDEVPNNTAPTTNTRNERGGLLISSKPSPDCRTSQTDMDNPNRVLTPTDTDQSDVSVSKQTI